MKIIYHQRTQARLAEGVHVREIVKALKEKGNEVIVVSPPGVDVFREASGEDTAAKQGFGLRVFWHFISRYAPEIVFEILELGYNFMAYAKLRSLFSKTKIDAFYERYAFFGWAGTYIAQKNKIPSIVEVNEISGFKRTRGQVLQQIAKAIEKKVFTRADAIVVVSHFLKEEISKMGIAPEKIHIVPNAVNAAEFSLDTANRDIVEKYGLENKVVLGFVGSFVKWHNFDFFLKTFEKVLKKSGKELRLMMVGDGPAKAEVEAQAKAYGVLDQVIFTGAVKHTAIPAYIKAMDICIIPHSNEYRSPIKLFEYMAMAKPVVSPRVKPIEEVVTDKANGVLFEPENLSALADSIIYLLENKAVREQIGARARETILKQYLWSHNAAKVIDIYETINKKHA
jgi:glycosyltransferase involved in cell wall biosynthesis